MTDTNGQAAPAAAVLADDDKIPTIRLGKKDWPVPEFSWKQTKKLMPQFLRVSRLNWNAVEEADLEMCAALYLFVLQHGTPDMTAEKFDALPVTLREMAEAIPTIAKQADLEMKVTKPGEQTAQAESSTGTN